MRENTNICQREIAKALQQLIGVSKKYSLHFKVIVLMVFFHFFQSVTIQEIYQNKYKNTFHKQHIDQYIHFGDTLTKQFLMNFCHPAQ